MLVPGNAVVIITLLTIQGTIPVLIITSSTVQGTVPVLTSTCAGLQLIRFPHQPTFFFLFFPFLIYFLFMFSSLLLLFFYDCFSIFVLFILFLTSFDCLFWSPFLVCIFWSVGLTVTSFGLYLLVCIFWSVFSGLSISRSLFLVFVFWSVGLTIAFFGLCILVCRFCSRLFWSHCCFSFVHFGFFIITGPKKWKTNNEIIETIISDFFMSKKPCGRNLFI